MVKRTYRCDRGYVMGNQYFHGWEIAVQKKDLNWEPLFKCKTARQAIDCIEKLYDHGGIIFMGGYEFQIEEAIKRLSSQK